jgi:hypothetical protein
MFDEPQRAWRRLEEARALGHHIIDWSQRREPCQLGSVAAGRFVEAQARRLRLPRPSFRDVPSSRAVFKRCSMPSCRPAIRFGSDQPLILPERGVTTVS